MVFMIRWIFKSITWSLVLSYHLFQNLTKLMALKFVFENKNRLDCSRITINGESAGGASVALLLLNDEAVEYIDGAVAQSGGTLTGSKVTRFFEKLLHYMTRLNSVELMFALYRFHDRNIFTRIPGKILNCEDST